MALRASDVCANDPVERALLFAVASPQGRSPAFSRPFARIRDYARFLKAIEANG
jgi:hypothetical protein